MDGRVRGLSLGRGDAWLGNDVYTVDNSSGELIRIDLAGNQTVIGSGFTEVRNLEFGTDGALYASEATNHRILRVPQVSVPLLSRAEGSSWRSCCPSSGGENPRPTQGRARLWPGESSSAWVDAASGSPGHRL